MDHAVHPSRHRHPDLRDRRHLASDRFRTEVGLEPVSLLQADGFDDELAEHLTACNGLDPPARGWDRGTGGLVTVLEQGHQPRCTKPRARLSRDWLGPGAGQVERGECGEAAQRPHVCHIIIQPVKLREVSVKRLPSAPSSVTPRQPMMSREVSVERLPSGHNHASVTLVQMLKFMAVSAGK
eukprot:1177924-Prorocentrum_minimum.AAC.1